MWDRMEVFYYVVKAGGFTKAEAVLHKSQSTLSRTVLLLEEEIGHKLLKRKYHGVVLTQKGEEVFNSAQKILMEIDTMKTHLREKNDMSGKVRISTTYAIGNYLLSEPLIEFNKQYPQISIDLVCNDTSIDIIKNEVDFAIRPYMEEDQESQEFIQEHLLTIHSGLYASPEYLKEFGTPKKPEDLDKHQLLTRSRAYENPYADVDWVLRIGREGKAARKPFYTSNSVESLFQGAEAGTGITVGYKEMKNVKNSKLKQVLPNLEGPKYKEYIIYQKKLKDI